MSIQKEGDNRLFKPQIHQKRGQNWQNFGDRNRSFSRDRVSYRQNFRSNHRRQSEDRCTQNGCDHRRGSYRCQNYGSRGDNGDRVNYRRDFSNDRNGSKDRNRSRTRERSLTPKRDDKIYHYPNTNLGTRNRSTSSVTMQRQN